MTQLEKNLRLELGYREWDTLAVQYGGLVLKFPMENHEKTLDELWSSMAEKIKSAPQTKESKHLYESMPSRLRSTILGMVELGFTMPRNLNPICALMEFTAEDPFGFEEHVEVKCVIIWDGAVILYASHDPRMDSEVRDKLVEIIGEGNVIIVPPNVGYTTIALQNGKKEPSPAFKEDYAPLSTGTEASIEDGLRLVYTRLVSYLQQFYLGCKIAEKPQQIADTLLKTQEEILDSVRQFTNTKFLQFGQRRKLSRNIRNKITDILVSLSEHSVSTRTVERMRVVFEDNLRKDDFAKDVFEKAKWRDDVSPGEIDREAALTIVEDARREIESSVSASVTLWAAIIGAIAGFLLSLVATHV